MDRPPHPPRKRPVDPQLPEIGHRRAASHGRQAARRLDKPLFRLGIPMFDRIGNAHKCYVGYRGSRHFVYEVANQLMEHTVHHGPGDWPLPEASRLAAQGVVDTACNAPAPTTLVAKVLAPGHEIAAASA